MLTPLGRRAATDPEVLTDALAAGLLTAKDAFDRDTQALSVPLGWREDGGAPIGRYYLDGVHDVLTVLTPQLGNGLGDPGPSSAAARHLAGKALHTNG